MNAMNLIRSTSSSESKPKIYCYDTHKPRKYPAYLSLLVMHFNFIKTNRNRASTQNKIKKG